MPMRVDKCLLIQSVVFNMHLVPTNGFKAKCVTFVGSFHFVWISAAWFGA